MNYNYGSVCSGAGTCALALHPLGWQTAWFSEIEAAPAAILAHHWPSVPNLGDMTTLPERIRSGNAIAPDLLVGGTPCQSFSVAGNRESLTDVRGNLTLTFCEIADAIDAKRPQNPCWILWENVLGVLNTKDNAFGCLLGRLAGAGQELHHPNHRWPNAGVVDGPLRSIAWRVFNAQHFGLAQRRRRVFALVGPRTSLVHPAEILFESQGLPGSAAQSNGEGQKPAAAACPRAASRRYEGVIAPDLARCVLAGEGRRQDWETSTLIAQPAISFDFSASAKFHMQVDTELVGTLLKGKQQAVAQDNGPRRPMAVRRLTPRECERLMGWPEDHTLVPMGGRMLADSQRYRICGNGWALPCVSWILQRFTRAVWGDRQ